MDIETLWDDETPDARFKEFLNDCGPVTFFAAVVADAEKTHSAGAFRRDQALYLAYKLRKMAREIEADFDDPGL